MEAWKVTRIGEREWQRESLFETVVDAADQRAAAVGVCLLVAVTSD